MRHRKDTHKLGRSSSHRKALLAALVRGLIREKRIETTLPKAREASRVADRLVTLARKDTLSARRQAIAELGDVGCVGELFDTIVPRCAGRAGGYTRIVKLGSRRGDGADMALLEWVDMAAAVVPSESEPEAAASA